MPVQLRLQRRMPNRAVLTEPLVAHVRDLATGEIGLFSGTREITLLDPQLAARLARAIG